MICAGLPLAAKAPDLLFKLIYPFHQFLFGFILFKHGYIEISTFYKSVSLRFETEESGPGQFKGQLMQPNGQRMPWGRGLIELPVQTINIELRLTSVPIRFVKFAPLRKLRDSEAGQPPTYYLFGKRAPGGP
jgi:hypothetical protein